MAYEKIIVGVDGSETSLEAVRFAARMAKLEGATLTAIYATPKEDDYARDVFAKASEAAAGEGVDAVTTSYPGDPSEALVAYVEKEGADLLIVGNKGMTGVGRFLLGSVPNKVSHQSPCDLMIVKTT